MDQIQAVVDQRVEYRADYGIWGYAKVVHINLDGTVDLAIWDNAAKFFFGRDRVPHISANKSHGWQEPPDSPHGRIL